MQAGFRCAVCGRVILIFGGVTLFFAGAHAAPAPRARQSGILLLVCPRFMAGGSFDSCGAILRPLPPFLAKEALVLRHGCRIRGKFPPEPPRSSAPLRRSSGLQSASVLNGCGSGRGVQSASGLFADRLRASSRRARSPHANELCDAKRSNSGKRQRRR